MLLLLRLLPLSQHLGQVSVSVSVPVNHQSATSQSVSQSLLTTTESSTENETLSTPYAPSPASFTCRCKRSTQHHETASLLHAHPNLSTKTPPSTEAVLRRCRLRTSPPCPNAQISRLPNAFHGYLTIHCSRSYGPHVLEIVSLSTVCYGTGVAGIALCPRADPSTILFFPRHNLTPSTDIKRSSPQLCAMCRRPETWQDCLKKRRCIA